MIAQIKIGGVWVSFGFPNSGLKPAPFYPWLVELAPIQEANGQETGSASFRLSNKAKNLIGVELRMPARVLADDETLQFEGLVSELVYQTTLTVKVDA